MSEKALRKHCGGIFAYLLRVIIRRRREFLSEIRSSHGWRVQQTLVIISAAKLWGRLETDFLVELEMQGSVFSWS
jgi:hypothetical protein